LPVIIWHHLGGSDSHPGERFVKSLMKLLSAGPYFDGKWQQQKGGKQQYLCIIFQVILSNDR